MRKTPVGLIPRVNWFDRVWLIVTICQLDVLSELQSDLHRLLRLDGNHESGSDSERG